MGKEKRGRQRGEGAFPSFFGVSVVFCEGSMTEKRVPVARCLVLHSHGEASACPRSVTSQQDDGPGRRVGGREARGWEKSTYRRQGPLGSMCLCRYWSFFWCVCFWLSSEYRVMSSPLSLCAFTLPFLVLLFGTRATLIGGRRERKGKCLPPAMDVRLGQGKRQGLEA